MIAEYIRKNGENSLKKIVDLGYELQKVEKLEWRIGDNIRLAFEIAYENKQLFIDAVDYYFKKWDAQDVLYPPVIVSRLFSFLGDKRVRDIVATTNDTIVNNWEFAYFYELPENLVNEEKCKELLAFLQKKTDSKIQISSYREMDFLSKYEKYDKEIFFKSCEIILSKKEYYPFIVQIYFELLFNPYCIKPNDLIAKFSNHIDLLVSMYFEMLRDNNFDFDGQYLVAIYKINPQVIIEYLSYFKMNHHSLSYNDFKRIFAIFSLENYIETFDIIFDELLQIPFISMTITSLLDNHLDPKNDEVTEKIVNWMKHYIDLYSDDKKRMKLLFEINAYIEQASRIAIIKEFLSKNTDFESFKELNLLPSSSSWSGSKLPLIQKRIDFLINLNKQLTDISLLKHKKYIQDKIENIKKYKDSVEINEIIGLR